MSTTVDREKILSVLADESQIREDPFSTLKEIAYCCSSSGDVDFGTELVLRALHHRGAFAGYEEIINELVRQVGLFPYLEPNELDLQNLIALEYHRAEGMPESTVFHRVQSVVYQQLLDGQNVVLSAPTSFGKSLIVDAVIASNKHKNIVIIVPTLALIDETRRRLGVFASRYKLVSQSSQLAAVKK